MSKKYVYIIAGAFVLIIILAIVANSYIMPKAHADDRENCAIQGRLKVMDYYNGEIDCQLGERSEAAIRAFQDAKGLPMTGTVGPKTWKALFGTPSADDYQPDDLKANTNRCASRSIEATVERLGQSRGLNGAVKAWQAKVFSADGLGIRYANWDLASDKHEECLPASAGARYTFNCTVRARPCRATAQSAGDN